LLVFDYGPSLYTKPGGEDSVRGVRGPTSLGGSPAHHSANISCSRWRTVVTVYGVSRPSRRRRRSASTVRSWSKATKPDRRWKRHAIRHGYARPLVVIGATITVR